MKAVKVETGGYIKLPKEMLRLFPTASKLAVWTEGDTIVDEKRFLNELLGPCSCSWGKERWAEQDR